jgi:long-subunit acyl-CoA synthetase (AMP-forming)
LIQSIDISVVKVQVHLYKDLLSNAIEQRLYENFESVLLRHDDLSTIVYTSGTTGTPK